MLVNLQHRVQPPVCQAEHWERFRILVEHPDLFNPLRARIVQAVEAVIDAQQNPAIESPRLGAQVLSAIDSWWHGEFRRRFPDFPNGSDSGLFGMVLWNYLAERLDWWCFAEQDDAHGYGTNAMRYWRLPAGHSLIPRQNRLAAR
jgi:hypothetical protein